MLERVPTGLLFALGRTALQNAAAKYILVASKAFTLVQVLSCILLS